MQMKLRRCSRCIHWDINLPTSNKDGSLSAPCDAQMDTRNLLVVPMFTRGSDTCSKFKRGRKPPPFTFGDMYG